VPADRPAYVMRIWDISVVIYIRKNVRKARGITSSKKMATEVAAFLASAPTDHKGVRLSNSNSSNSLMRKEREAHFAFLFATN
jgi:hypothetical protein